MKHHPDINISVKLLSLSVSSYEFLPEIVFSSVRIRSFVFRLSEKKKTEKILKSKEKEEIDR